MRVYTFKCSEQLMSEFDEICMRLGIRSRSKCIRIALNSFIYRYRNMSKSSNIIIHNRVKLT